MAPPSHKIITPKRETVGASVKPIAGGCVFRKRNHFDEADGLLNGIEVPYGLMLLCYG
jgi:hypothetical protein